MNKITSTLFLLLFLGISFYSYSQNNYYFQSSNGDLFATHDLPDHDAMVYVNEEHVVWGTTIDDGSGFNTVFIQSYEYPIGNSSSSPSINFSTKYLIHGFNGLANANFEGMVTDGDQVVFTARINQYLGAGLPNSEIVFVMSIDPYTGSINWKVPLTINDDSRHQNIAIINDMAGGFLVAYDIRKINPFPKLRTSHGIGIARISKTGILDWVRDYRDPILSPIIDHHVLHDFHQHSVTGDLIITGRTTNNVAQSQIYFAQFDPAGGLIGVGGNVLAINPNEPWVTDDGTDYWLGFHSVTLNPGFNLLRLNTGGQVTGAWDFLPLPGGNANLRQLEYNASSNHLELLLELSNATLIAQIDPSTQQVTTVLESDYISGVRTEEPVSFTIKQQGIGLEPTNYLVLSHPNGSSITNIAPANEFIKIHDFTPMDCQVNNSYSQSSAQIAIGITGTIDLVNFEDYTTVGSEIYPEPYTGDIYDCDLSQSGSYRKKNTEEISAIKVFPNPAQDVIWIENIDAEEFTIQLRDINGKLLKTMKNQRKINIRDLSSGVYSITVFSEEGRQTAMVSVF